MLLLNLLISVGANARSLIVFRAVVIRTVVEGAVSLANGPASPLIHEVPIETDERPMLIAFVLQKRGTLFDPKLLQISTRTKNGHALVTVTGRLVLRYRTHV